MMLVPSTTVITTIDGKRVILPPGLAFNFDEETARSLLDSGSARIASNLDPLAKAEPAPDASLMAAKPRSDVNAEAIAEAAARGVAAAFKGEPTPEAAPKPKKAKAGKAEDGDDL